MNMRGTSFVAMVIVGWSVTIALGCELTWGEECTPRTSKCEGDVWMYCTPGRAWQRTDCGEHSCISSATVQPEESRCAISPSQDPMCLARGPDWTGNLCDENRSVRCRSGFRMKEDDCGDRRCVEIVDRPETVCASSDSDPLCIAYRRSDGFLCDGNTRIECRHSVRVSARGCGALTCVIPDSCTPAWDNDAVCALSPAPDSLCDGRRWGTCDGNMAVGCHCGYRISEQWCARCVDLSSAFRCDH